MAFKLGADLGGTFTDALLVNQDSKETYTAKVPSTPEDSSRGVIIEKSYASAFFATDLRQCLKTLNVDTAIVTGFTTSGCVRASAVDALQWSFKVVGVQDAVGDRNDQAHEANLRGLGLKYADDEEYLEEIIPAPEFGGYFIHPAKGESFGVDFVYHF
jgi:nicotinamidase-related amidase